MELRLLGPLQVLVDGTPVVVGGAAERALLARLALEAGRVVSAEHLIDSLWGEDLPAHAANALQGRVSRLRSAFRAVGLAETLIVSRRPGYLLDVDPATVDVHRFARLVEEARRGAPDRYPAALGLWQGPALAEFDDHAWARDQRQRLDELRLTATEEWLQARLAGGQHAELVDELTDLVTHHPLRERLHGQLMLALYRAGRQADALAAFQRARRILDDELGLDPSPELRALEQAMLRQDPTLAAPTPAARPSEAPTRGQEQQVSAAEAEEAEEPPALPRRLTSFIGRDRERVALAELLAARRLVTVTGPGGVGKTSLAIAAAAAEPAADGTWFVPLAGVAEPAEPAGLAAAVAEAIGAPTGPGSPNDRVLRRLRHRRALLVLDNCEHLAAAAAALADRLLGACPDLRVLATSREPLGLPGEAQFPLAPLAVPPADAAPVELTGSGAVRLFVERARDADPTFVLNEDTSSAVALICRRLDGLPLALELAAARVKLLPVSDIAARLDDRFRLLTSGPRTADARQRTLRAAIDWSHHLLTDEERALFRRLAVFRGGWSLDAAEQVCGQPDRDDRDDRVGGGGGGGGGGDGFDVFELHARLVDRSLIVARAQRPGSAGFGMLETLREYAADRLDEAAERERIEAAHAAYFTGLAGWAEARLRGAGQDAALALLRGERDNLRAALAWGRAHPGSDLGLRLAAALGWFWYFTSAQEGVPELEAMLAAAKGASATHAAEPRARALQALSVAARPGSCIVHPDPRCASAARESLQLFRDIGDTTAAAYSLTLLAVEGIADGDPGAALDMLDEAAAAFDRAADRWGLALVGFVRMELHFLVGDPDTATEQGAQALAGFRELDDHWGISAVQYHHGLALHRAGRLREALAVHEAALIPGRRGTTNTVPYVLADMGHIALQLGDLDRAAQHLAEAGVVARQLGADANPVALIGEGHLARERGDLAAAERNYRAALRLLASGATPEWEAAAHNGLGFLAAHAEDLDAADAHHRAAWQAAARAPAAGARAGATALEGLAGVAAAARGDGIRAAHLLGTAALWRQLRHQPALRTEHRDIDRAAAAARDLLGEPGYEQAHTDGLQLPPEAIIDLSRPAHAQLSAWLTVPARPGPGAERG
jgi:predicted ATPase/DNA-binding SARP family transcriptional activator